MDQLFPAEPGSHPFIDSRNDEHFRISSFAATLMANLNIAILFEDQTRHILFVNTAFRQMFGVPDAVVPIGLDCAKSAREDAQSFQEPDRYLLRIEEILRLRCPVLREMWKMKDGRVLRRDYIPVYWQERFLGSLWQYEDITTSFDLERQLQQKVDQQASLSRLSLLALTGTDLFRLFDEAVEIVAGMLAVDYCTILEYLADSDELLFRSGVGWKPGVIGQARIKADQKTLAGFSANARAPVMVDDFAEKERFFPLPMLENIVATSAMGFPIPGRTAPWGVIVVHSRDARHFSEDNLHFLQSVAHLLATAIRRKEDELEQQHIDQMLRTSESRNRALLGAIPDLIFIQDRVGTFLDFSSHSLDALFVPPDQFLGKGVKEVMPPAVAEEFLAIYPQVLEKNEVATVQYSLKVDSQVMYFEARLAPFGPDRILSVVHDITSQKQTEEKLRKANRALHTLSECNEAVVRATEEQALLQEICRILTGSGGYQLAWIGYKDEQTRLVKPTAAAGESADYLQAISVTYEDTPYGQGPSGRAIRIGKIQVIQKTANDPNFAPWRANAEKYGLASVMALPLSVDGEVIGCLSLYSAEPDAFSIEEMRLLKELSDDLAYGIHSLRQQAERKRVELLAAQANMDLMQAYEATIEGWAQALELREKETAGHSRRVVDLTVRVARYMGVNEEQLRSINYGALLHDIGKMGVPHEMLMKTGPLGEDEWAIMRQHPNIAYNLLKDIAYLKPAIDIPLYHHERWDGHGYPGGLKGEAIPLAARIFAIVDVWDALLHDRPYRKAWPIDQVREYIHQQAGKQFDPGIAKLFLEHFAQET